MSAAVFVGLGTAMALAGPSAGSSAPPRSNRASIDPFRASQGSNDAYDRGEAANNDDGGDWGALPPSGFGSQPSRSGGNFAFGGGSGGANTATHGS